MPYIRHACQYEQTVARTANTVLAIKQVIKLLRRPLPKARVAENENLAKTLNVTV